MRSLINLVKSNLITVSSIAVVVLSLVFLGYFHVKDNALQEKIAQRTTMLRKIQLLSKQRVDVPSSSADGKMEELRIPINPIVIQELGQINKRLDAEYQGIFEFAVARNRQDHLTLVDDLFPKPRTESSPFLARERYEDIFSLMLLSAPGSGEEVSPRDASLPYLDAGMPPLKEKIEKELQDIEEEVLASAAIHGSVNLTAQQQEDLRNLQAEHHSVILQERASRIHIYAQTDWQSPDFPFDVAKWSDTPQPHEMWEGQLEQWIQQDIVRALAIANDASNPKSNVLDAPVKRLLRIQIVPGGYIGLHTYGGVEAMGLDHRGIASTTGRVISMYGPPAGGVTGSADKAQSVDFFVGPSGRTSNALYDVRQALLVAVVDFQQLPKLFNAISSVNFMTVVGCRISDVDEYEALAEGYLYGVGDAVEIHLLIETIWLRNWTEELMPELVKQYVGLLEWPEDDMNRPGQHRYPTPGGMPGMRPGQRPGGGYDPFAR